MWLLLLMFFMLTFLLGWLLFGYFLLLWVMGRLHGHKKPEAPKSWPMLSIIVPVYNEEDNILDKLNDIRGLDYPVECLEVFFADGGSTDKSMDLLTEQIRDEKYINIINCPQKGKINQLNHVIPMLRGDIIINTDADARLDPDLAKWMASEFAMAPDIWVVGAFCTPDDGMEIEHYYWTAQNKGRLIENDASSSAIVIAQCYGFRKELLCSFPDDIYVAFLAHSTGKKTVYSRYAKAVETRLPKTYEAFITHKFRKSNAFLRESLRFIYRLPEMSPFSRVMLITRTGQQMLLPWLIMFWLALMIVLVTMMQLDVIIIGIATLLFLFIITSRVFAWTKLPDEKQKFSFSTILNGYVITLMIMLATGISYPIYRQNSSYSRLSRGSN